MYWSVRRELWENRSIYIAPLVAAAVHSVRLLDQHDSPAEQDACHIGARRCEPARCLAEPYDAAAGLLMGTALIVGVFYCLDALHGERRDRSILFWKSLPVSDLTPCSRRPAFRSWFSAVHLRDHRCHTMDHAAAEYHSPADERRECGDAMAQLSLFQMSLFLF